MLDMDTDIQTSAYRKSPRTHTARKPSRNNQRIDLLETYVTELQRNVTDLQVQLLTINSRMNMKPMEASSQHQDAGADSMRDHINIVDQKNEQIVHKHTKSM